MRRLRQLLRDERGATLVETTIVFSTVLILTFGIRTGSAVYHEAALMIALLGFVSTVALAKFLLRGEVIE